MERRIIERPFAIEKRRPCNRLANLLGHLQSVLELRVGKDHHELIAAITCDSGLLPLHNSLEKESDFTQDLTAGQMSVAVIDHFELIEIHEQQNGRLSALTRFGNSVGQAHVEPPVVEEAGEIVFSGQFLGALAIERVLQREGRVAGENLQQRFVALGEDFSIEAIDQLEDAANVFADVDRDANNRMRLVSDLLIDFRIEKDITFDIGGEMRRSTLINLAGDPMFRRKPLIKTSSLSRRDATLRNGSSRRIDPDSAGTNSFAFCKISRRT